MHDAISDVFAAVPLVRVVDGGAEGVDGAVVRPHREHAAVVRTVADRVDRARADLHRPVKQSGKSP